MSPKKQIEAMEPEGQMVTINVRVPPAVVAKLDEETQRLMSETGVRLKRSAVLRSVIERWARG
jgi:hypothetical protein